MANTAAETNTRALIRVVQAGQPLNGHSAADCGPWEQIMAEVIRAYDPVSPQTAMQIVAADPTLLRLASDEQFTTPPVLAETEHVWLDTKTVLTALDRGEVGDAELLAQLYRERLAYDHAEKQWYIWNGYHWRSDRRRQVWNLIPNQLAAQYIQAAAELVKTNRDENKGKADDLWKRAGSLRFRSRITNVLDHASKLPTLALAGDEWEAHPLLMAVINGVIDLAAGSFRPGRPADYIRAAAPVQWAGLDAPAPRWEQFLLEIFAGDVELINFIQRLLGYAITGQVTEHILPIFWGQGRNGKGTLIETIKHVLGDLAAPVSKDVLVEGRRDPGAATPHLYALRSLRLAWVSETKEGAELNAEQVKWLTGGDTLTARQLNANPVVFKPRHTLFLLTNPKPKANPDDYALWKRLLLIPFTQSFVDSPQADNEHRADPELPAKLRNEAAGILAWLVRGSLNWRQNGLNPPPSLRLATQSYQQEEDDITLFIEECCLAKADTEVRAAEIYTAYRKWAESYGLRPASQTTFGRRLGKRFTRRLSAGVIYSGIGLLDHAPR